MWLFLQTTLNVDILYIVGDHFLPQLTLRDCYLKIRLCLTRINYQSFANLYEITCHQSEHFLSLVEGTITIRRPQGIDSHPKPPVGWPENGVSPLWSFDLRHALCTCGTAVNRAVASSTPKFRLLLNVLGRCVFVVKGGCRRSCKELCVTSRERET